MKENEILRNAEYFRKLQGISPNQDKIDETVEYILNEIESDIKCGLKDCYQTFNFYYLNYKIVAKVNEILMKTYGFKVHSCCYEGGSCGSCIYYQITVDWSE